MRDNRKVMNKEDFEMEEFDYKMFKKELNSGDLCGLQYLEKTLIRDLKDKCNDNYIGYKYQDYIVSLFYATMELNKCNDIYETSNVENNFNYDLYFKTRDLLLEELGFDLEDLYK